MPVLTVSDYLQKYCDTSWQQFYTAFKDEFEKAPAAVRHHHNFTGGLALHTAEVIRAMFEIRDKLTRKSLVLEMPLPETKPDQIIYTTDEFSDSDIVIAGFLHDFAKIKQYVQDEQGDWQYVKMTMPQETWTLMTLAQHGVTVSEAQTLSLLYAEGGFSEFRDKGQPNGLAWLLHMADIWSSQIINPIIKLPICPRCGKTMQKKNGARGVFWGCSGYPVCSMTMNLE